MYRGEKLEIQAEIFLKENFSNSIYRFEREGGMNSTKSDICVFREDSPLFNIEVKSKIAQSGQFVIHANVISRRFIFSRGNKSLENKFTSEMISHMESYFQYFYESGTKGKHIDIDPSNFSHWIINYYTEKNVKYIISFFDEFIIIPIEKISEYFEITAICREKKSGSRPVAAKYFGNVIDYINSTYEKCHIEIIDNDLYVESLFDIESKYFDINGNSFYLSQISGNSVYKYRVRQLSKTKNMNVIFNIELMMKQNQADLNQFLNEFLL